MAQEHGGSDVGQMDPPLTATSFIEDRYRSRPFSGRRLYDVLGLYGAARGISPNVVFGVYNYARLRDVVGNDRLGKVLQFIDDLHELTGTPDFFKSRSFNYIFEGEEMAEVFNQALSNARFMVELAGVRFFAREHGKRGIIFKAPIADSDFFLSLKGGSGAGTFSMDFAIGVDKGQKALSTLGELWRTGVDTEIPEDGQGRIVRIIRTGTGVIRNDPLKTEKFKEFRKRFKITPQRALAFLALYFAYSLGAEGIKALSTNGAKRLSSLGRSANPYDYSQLFKGVGFVEGENPHWLYVPDLPENFYFTLETTPENQNGLRAYEASGMHKVLEGFQSLQGPEGEECPIRLQFVETPEEMERVLAAFRNIHGWQV